MTRRSAILVLLFLMLFSNVKGLTLPPPPGWGASASVAPSGQTLYYIIRGDTATVTYPSDWFNNYWGSFTKPTGALIIPDSVTTSSGNTYPVTTIGDAAFTYCTGLTSVVIPNTVKFIKDDPFYCTNITSIQLSDSLKTIGNWAFRGCFFDSIILPNGLKTIGEYAFMGCTNLSSIIIPNTVISIGREAFKNCINLTSITLPEGMTNIKQEVFFGCSSLDSIVIPSSVTNIGWKAFKNCSNLSSVIMQSDTAPELWHNAYYSEWGMDSVFGNNADGRVFRIPCGSWNSYYNTWPVYREALREPSTEISIAVNANDTSRGRVECGYHNANVGCDSITAIIATPYLQYHFDHWSNGSISNPDTLNLTGDSSVTAFFIGVSVLVDDSTRGYVTHDKIDDHTERITATPYPQYHFDHWGNGSIANPDTLHLTGDSSVTAFFIGISVLVDDSTRGYATHNKIDDHTERIIATPFEHYYFDHWSNGSTSNPDTLNLVGDSTIIAYFSPNRYHLTVNVNNSNWGLISLPNGDTADYLDTIVIVAMPTEHYHVASWNGTSAVSASKDTAWVMMNSNNSITCNFAIDTHLVTAIANNNDRGVTTGDGEYAYGTPCILTAIPYTGFVFTGWSNGVQTNPYAFQVTENVVLIANFLAESEVGIDNISEEYFNIHSSGGRIVVEGTTEEVRVFDITGRSIQNETLTAGVYLVKVGERPAKKIVIVK